MLQHLDTKHTYHTKPPSNCIIHTLFSMQICPPDSALHLLTSNPSIMLIPMLN